MQIQAPLSGSGFVEEFFNVLILNRTDELIQALCFFRSCRDGDNLVMLGKKNRERQTDIADSGHSDPVAAFDGNHVCNGVILQQVLDLKTENRGELFKLLNGGHILAVFQIAEDGAVDSGLSGKLCLGETESAPAGANCIG